MTAIPERLASALADRYRVERELGEGGMATVYLAEDLKHHRQVALKVLKPELAATLGADRFLREIDVAASLQHPHILPLFDSGEAGGFLFYVMPYIQGESLRARLARGGELPVPEAAKILRDVLDALAHAHQHGVVHRDIKPDNVLLSGRHALVTDFGVAKAVSEATGRQSLTTVGVALGTPSYMAPEQATADPNVDFRADLYAVGAMAYEMLTGNPPFSGASPQAILAAQVTEPARPITAVRPSVPALLGQLVMQCLEKRPADRPTSADALLPTLEALATPSGGVTPAATAPFAAAHAHPRRGPIPRMAAIALGVVAFGGAAYGGYRLLRPAARASAHSLAVLPFENAGGDTTNQVFTNGVQDEILTDLTRIGALQVTSRTSVQEYRHTTKSVKQIGAELGVATVLEGQVQRAGSQVHVTVQLVDATRDRQIWASSYDRKLTAENIFAIQGDIAQNVAHALQASLTASQESAMETSPTADLEALDWYHRGKELFDNRSGVNDTAISAAFGRAVARDSSFAGAWAWLAAARSWEVRDGWTTDTVPARTALDRALALAPSAPETELAQAFFTYYAKADYNDALRHFRALADKRPGDVDAIQGIGYIARRQGRWDDALEHERKVITLSPREPSALYDLGESYMMLRRFDEADKQIRRALILDPRNERTIADLSFCLLARGDTAAARRVASGMAASHEFGALTAAPWLIDRWAGRYAAASTRVDSLLEMRPVYRPGKAVEHALDDLAAGDTGRARLHSDSAAHLARSAIAHYGPTDVFGNLADLHMVLGLAEAIEGKASDAAADVRRAIALNPRARDAIEASRAEETLVLVHVILGHRDEAIRLIREQAHRPLAFSSILPLSRATIRMDPLFAGIRPDPRLRALLADDAAWVVR